MTGAAVQQTAAPEPVDRITLEVIRHQLVSVPNQIERNVTGCC